jgi:hypothetical protein
MLFGKWRSMIAEQQDYISKISPQARMQHSTSDRSAVGLVTAMQEEVTHVRINQQVVKTGVKP